MSAWARTRTRSICDNCGITNQRWIIYSSFAFFGLLGGMSVVGNSELKVAFHLTDGHLGSMLTVGSLVALPLQLWGGALLHRFGKSLYVGVCALRSVAALGVVLTVHTWQLYFLFALMSVGAGVFNIIINAGALHHEHETGQPVLSTSHALFSVGAIVGSAATGLLLAAGGGVTVIYLAMAVMAAAALTVADVTNGLAHDPEAGVRPPFNWAIVKNRAVLSIAVVTIIGGFGEAVMYVWPTIYLREQLHSAALVGALGSSSFYAAMALGRFGAAPAQNRYGRLTILTCAGAVIVVGMAIGLATQSVVVTIAGFIVTGVAYSVVTPIGYSVTATAAGNNPTAVSSLLSTVMASSYLIAPVIIGSIASALSLRLGLGVVLVTGLGVASGGFAFRNAHPDYA